MAEYTQDDVLVNLSDANLALSDPSQDIRDRKVIDQHGDQIGHVSGLFVDKDQKTVRMLQVAAGGFLGLGERHFLVPVEAVANVAQNEVRINQTRDRVVSSPLYDPNLIEARSRDFWEPYYRYYGYAPYWQGTYEYGRLGYPLV